MGMYTEFILGCSLSKNTPKVCIDALDYSINGKEKKPKYDNPKDWIEKDYNDNYIERTTPENEIISFINEYDFNRLFHCSSYYFGAANPTCKFIYDKCSESYMISTRADLKNYSDQIEKFLEYLKPYVESGSGYPHEIYAYVQYEEDPFPVIYAMDGIYKEPIFNGEAEKYRDKIRKLNNIFSKLFQEVCPDWSITDEEYAKRGLEVDDKPLDLITTWDWMVDHIIETNKNKNNEI